MITIRNTEKDSYLAYLLGIQEDGSGDISDSQLARYCREIMKELPHLLVIDGVEADVTEAARLLGNIAYDIQQAINEMS